MLNAASPVLLLRAGDHASAIRFMVSAKGRAAFMEHVTKPGPLLATDQLQDVEKIWSKMNKEKRTDDLGDGGDDEKEYEVRREEFSRVVDVTLRCKKANR